MAAATGLAVANIYYAQPLLDTIGGSFGVARHTAGYVVTMTQVGYTLGLVFLVPLGDRVDRRRLVVGMSLLTSAALVAAALAPTLVWFALISLVIGITAVVAQVLVPFAAHLAADHQRGRVVGRVMSGLLLGILLARTVSGVVSDLLGWRAMFWIAAVLMLGQALVLARLLPSEAPQPHAGSYGRLLASVVRLIREEPLLRRRIFYGMAVFATFSVFWTALPFLMAGPAYGYGDSAIGAFGLVGVVGAVCASWAGHLHDHGRGKPATGVFLGVTALAFVLMGSVSDVLWAVIAGVILLDLGVQGTQILNQSAIYQLRPEARSRITTAYMSCYFAGGAIGSAAATAAFGRWGWTGVAALGVVFPLAGLLFWLTERGD